MFLLPTERQKKKKAEITVFKGQSTLETSADWSRVASLPVRYQDGADLRSSAGWSGRAEQGRKRTKNKRIEPHQTSTILRILNLIGEKMQEVVAVLEMPCWWGCGEQEHREFKGPRESLSGELQTGVDEGLDYKRGTALDQVISDSVDVGGKAAEL